MIRSLLALLVLAFASPANAQYWSRSWAAAPVWTPRDPNAVPELSNSTVRQVVRLSTGGKAIRLRLSNEMSDVPLRIGRVEVAFADRDGRIAPGTSHTVSFASRLETNIPMHAPVLSDPIAMPVAPLARITISIYLPDGAPSPTIHPLGAATGWAASGDQTDAVALSGATNFYQRFVIAAVDVESAAPQRAIVTLGDSITDGVAATRDADRRWPDILAERLQADGLSDVGVANAGISGNRILIDETGPNALSRFDRDVMAVPSISHLIVLEGINDIGNAWRQNKTEQLRADDIIFAYRQMLARARDQNVKVIFATILPYKGARYWSEWGEAVRQQVNNWIRSNNEAAGYVDFDVAVRDPDDAQRIAKAYDKGDGLHPNDAGFGAMVGAIDVGLLRSDTAAKSN